MPSGELCLPTGEFRVEGDLKNSCAVFRFDLEPPFLKITEITGFHCEVHFHVYLVTRLYKPLVWGRREHRWYGNHSNAA